VYQQVLDPVRSSLGLPAAVAVLPLLLLFVLLGVFRVRAWLASVAALAAALVVAVAELARVSSDQRAQGVIVAYCSGSLLEGLAGFGTPVAITSVMLVALGFAPLRAAAVARVANTAPVSFGALAVPITTLGAVTRLPQGEQALPVALVAGVVPAPGVRLEPAAHRRRLPGRDLQSTSVLSWALP
jgi:lactate permease